MASQRFRTTSVTLLTLGTMPLAGAVAAADSQYYAIAAVSGVLGVAFMVASQLVGYIELDDVGIHIVSWGERRTLPYRSIDHVSERVREDTKNRRYPGQRSFVRTTVVALRAGPSVEVSPNDVQGFLRAARQRHGAWVDAQERKDVRRDVDPARLEPGTADAASWLAAVRSLKVDPWDYRSVGKGLDDDTLWGIVEANEQPPARRLGAALALAPLREANHRALLRAAAGPVELREALDAVAGASTDEELVAVAAAWLTGRAPDSAGR